MAHQAKRLKKYLKKRVLQYGHTYLYDGGTGERFDQAALLV